MATSMHRGHTSDMVYFKPEMQPTLRQQGSLITIKFRTCGKL